MELVCFCGYTKESYVGFGFQLENICKIDAIVVNKKNFSARLPLLFALLESSR